MAWRVAKLSVQSRTISAAATAVKSSSRLWIAMMVTSGLTAFSAARAASTFTAPTDSAR
jgi:hypothetical protein